MAMSFSQGKALLSKTQPRVLKAGGSGSLTQGRDQGRCIGVNHIHKGSIRGVESNLFSSTLEAGFYGIQP